jgi:adenine deaminase
MIRATFERRAVVEGHGAGLRDIATICGFAAAGLASDHEAWTPEEVWEKLARGIFMELRPYSMDQIIPFLLAKGLADWSQIAFTTDDRSASDTVKLGGSDYNVRTAMQHGLSPEIAIQCVTINPARHMRLTQWVGSLAPGRFADVVLLGDVAALEIVRVWADGGPVSEGKRFTGLVPKIEWPEWATRTVNIKRTLTDADFRIAAAPGRERMSAAVLRPFHWADGFITMELSVQDGAVQRDGARNITKFAIVDRFSGEAKVSKMFWLGCGPGTPETALGCSVMHDKHKIWVCGSVVARVHYEVGGLMTCRPAADLDVEMQHLYAEAAQVDWMYEPSFHPRWFPGFPERLIFATLTCAPWQWVLVAPCAQAPDGFVNVQTGETHPVVW